MAEQIGTFTLSTAGNPVTTGGLFFLPSTVQFFICSKSTADNIGHFSTGAASNTTGSLLQWARSTFSDTTGSKSANSVTKCISHYERVSGTITEVLSASLTGFATNGGGDYGFTFNVTTGNSGYQIAFIARS